VAGICTFPQKAKANIRDAVPADGYHGATPVPVFRPGPPVGQFSTGLDPGVGFLSDKGKKIRLKRNAGQKGWE
jgi:hypothetical protein